MKIFFTLLSLSLIYSCASSKTSEIVNTSSLEQTIEQDSIAVPKPAMLNGKVITPAQNSTTIGESKEKK